MRFCRTTPQVSSLLGTVVAAALLWTQLPGLRADEPATSGVVPLASFTVEKRGDHLIVPLKVGGRTLPCLVDTGCTHNLLDVQHQAVLGKQQGTAEITTAQGGVEVAYFESPKMRLGPVKLGRTEPVLCYDCSELRKGLGLDIQAVVGMAALKEHIVEIDFDEGKLSILPNDAEPDPHWGEPLPLTADRAGLRYFVTLSVAGIDSSFLLDTGASSTSIERDLTKQLLKLFMLRDVGTLHFQTFDGKYVEPVYFVRELSLGPFTHRQVEAHRDGDSKLGLDYLSRYRVVLDFPGRKIYLNKGAKYDARHRRDMAGLHPTLVDGEMIVTFVAKDGPARRLGLQVGDKLEQVDGRDASSYTSFQLRELFTAGDGQHIALTYSRAGQTKQVNLVLDDPMAPATATRTVVSVRRFLRR